MIQRVQVIKGLVLAIPRIAIAAAVIISHAKMPVGSESASESDVSSIGAMTEESEVTGLQHGFTVGIPDALFVIITQAGGMYPVPCVNIAPQQIIKLNAAISNR